MDGPFERYQAALQQGHRAVIDGRPREALKHYNEAATLADSRPLPLELSRLYLLRGWPHRAGERLQLLALKPDDELRSAVRALAAEHASTDPRLGTLAGRSEAAG